MSYVNQQTELPTVFTSQFHCSHGTLAESFERTAAAFPHNIAVTCGDQHFTYQEISKRSEMMAHYLQNHGALEGSIIAIVLDKTPEMIIAIIASLKLRCAYVPLDPYSPDSRLDDIILQCSPSIIITSGEYKNKLRSLNYFLVDADNEQNTIAPPVLSKDPDSSDLAYVIFTSGSTGKPKGVMVSNDNVMQLFQATKNLFQFNSTDVWTFFHSATFDFSVWEMWGALLHGGRLVLISREVARNPGEFYKILVKEGVTVLNQTPSSFRNLISTDLLQVNRELNLRYVIFGGEVLVPATLAAWVERHGTEAPQLINMYGITETTVHVTWKKLEKHDIQNTMTGSPIGIPIGGMKIAVLDAAGKPVADGAVGEMVVAGHGVSQGYIGQKELTAQRFTERNDTGGSKEIWYASGDLGARLPTGEFIYCGRADRQMKVRGYRIEPSEIETCLRKHPSIQDAVVICHDFGEGDVRIVAFILMQPGACQSNVTNLTEHGSQYLPSYMLPSAYIEIEQIPTNINGKVDEDRLRQIIFEKQPVAEYVDANEEHDIHQEVASIWRSVLGLNETSCSGDFFHLGGTSFTLIRLLNAVNQKYQINLQADIFCNGATLETLSDAVCEKV